MLRSPKIVAAVACGVLFALAAPAIARDDAPVVTPDVALAWLKAGNGRFVANPTSKGQPTAARRAETAQSQHPFAIILGCADSRTAPEIVFDQNIGDLFVVRTAGNLVDDHALGSIEYAVEHLGSRLIVVLGHERCGAVKAALDSATAPGHIGSLVRDIQPAVEAAKSQPGDALANTVKENARLVAEKIRRQAELGGLAPQVRIVTAYYHLDTGEVQWLALPDAAGSAEQKAYPFFPFCIDWHDAKKRTFQQQAEMLKSLGYDGVGHIWLDKVAERLQTLDAAGLKLYQITMTVDIAPDKQAYDPRFKDVLAMVKGRHVQFALLMNGGKPSDSSLDRQAVKILREMSDLAGDSGAQLLLYPHQGCWIERIEDSIRVADKVDRPNVGVMFNLCHWLRVDKQRDYKPLLKRAMPRLWAVSINGADQFDEGPGWGRYIQPLDRGSFDVGGLLKTLKELGYRGPIGLQCFGIGGDAREHLARSMAAWRKLSANLRD